MGISLISWKTSKRSVVALSTCEAEIMAICEGVRELKWIAGLLSELGMNGHLNLPIMLSTDSQSAVKWIKNSYQHARTKHINRKYYFVRNEVERGNIQVQFVRSEETEGDLLTKSLSAEKLLKCLMLIGLCRDI